VSLKDVVAGLAGIAASVSPGETARLSDGSTLALITGHIASVALQTIKGHRIVASAEIVQLDAVSLSAEPESH
jgi:hypothetical protein